MEVKRPLNEDKKTGGRSPYRYVGPYLLKCIPMIVSI